MTTTQIQASGHKLQICDSTTGHCVSNIAFCDTAGRAEMIAAIFKSHGELVAALQALFSNGHLITFVSDTHEDVAIKSAAIAALAKASK